MSLTWEEDRKARLRPFLLEVFEVQDGWGWLISVFAGGEEWLLWHSSVSNLSEPEAQAAAEDRFRTELNHCLQRLEKEVA